MNEEELARVVVESWDMDTLMSFAMEQLTIFYLDPENESSYQVDLEQMEE